MPLGSQVRMRTRGLASIVSGSAQRVGATAMTYRVRTESRETSLDLDRTVWVLEGDAARVEVWPALGFNCYRWQVVRDGAAFELLYAAANLFTEYAPTRSGFPVLFPFPN